MKRAVVLLSGGLDSATVLAIAKRGGFSVCALSVLYGQRHDVELVAARKVAASQGAEYHRTVSVDMRCVESSLTSRDSLPVSTGGIPHTYVPARNTIFLSLALAWAETLTATDIFIGVNAVDYSGYPDCRPEFIQAFEHLANLATKAGVTGSRIRIHAPLIAMSKAEIIRAGQALGVDYGITHSCYDPEKRMACGKCDSCILRLAGFAELGIKDPALYVGR